MCEGRLQGEAPAATTTIGDSIRRARDVLNAAGVENAADEARRLVAAALDWSAAELLSRSDNILLPAQAARMAGYLARRARHEPLSRIVGVREFYGRPFKVTPATLDPRPDTETLIDAALELLGGDRARPCRILDIGTGTGAILVTLLAELPQAQGIATDIDAQALQVAAENARTLGVAARAQFICTDVAAGVVGPFDLVVSNPPYIPSVDIHRLEPAVRNYDPLLALDGGRDGLGIHRQIANALPSLVNDGWTLLEVGFDQADAVVALLESASKSPRSKELRCFSDVAGIRRVVASRTRMGTQT